MSTHLDRSGDGGPAPGERLRELEQAVEQLTAALTNRAAIDQSKGVLMRHFGIDADTAFGVLLRWSSHTNAKVSVLAERITGAAAEGGERLVALLNDLVRTSAEGGSGSSE